MRDHVLTILRLTELDGKFYASCVASGKGGMKELHALIDTGASVTAVRGDICQGLSLRHAGSRPVTCVHGEHAGMMVQRYFCTMGLGERTRRLIVYELGRLEEGGNAVDAILGIDMLGGCRMTLDWARMEGVLEA